MLFHLKSILFSVLFSSSFFGACALAYSAGVSLPQGLLQGAESGDAVTYKGIPYASPPVGAWRWNAPRAPQKWSGVRDASQFGNICVQTKDFNPNGVLVGDEDCLTLNIWKPKQNQNPLPVMVFFHGGSFAWGSSSGKMKDVVLYDGTQLAAKGGVIVVTVNYRLGAFGFLSEDILQQKDGNFGLMDQIASLKWIQKNISYFGGDAKKVTIFGESAGAYSVLGLLSSPLAQGLFSQALMQSGSWIATTKTQALEVGRQFLRETSCSTSASPATCLRKLTAEQVLQATQPLMQDQGARILFGPYVDGSVLPDLPVKLLQSGKFNQVPLLIGTNSDEMSTLILPELLKNPFPTAKDFEQILQRDFGKEVAQKIQAQYPLDQFASPTEALKVIYGDGIFHCPTQQIAEAVVQTSQPVWRYVFHHTYHKDPLRVLGAGHGLELAYVFQNFPPWYHQLAPDLLELRLSDQMIHFWSGFAKNGSPTPEGDSPLWPRFDQKNGAYLQLDLPLQSLSKFRGKECRFWKDLN